MRTTVDDDDDSLFSRFKHTCCNTGCKQFTWGTGLIFFLILFIAMAGYYSRQEREKAVVIANITICATGGGFETSERLALQAVVITGAILSMMGSSFIIVSFFAFPTLYTMNEEKEIYKKIEAIAIKEKKISESNTSKKKKTLLFGLNRSLLSISIIGFIAYIAEVGMSNFCLFVYETVNLY